jgi:AI-2 transport protein TqsA
MDETSPESPGRALYVIAALVIVIAGMRAAASWVTPLLLSVFVAMILNHPIRSLQRRGVSRGLSLLVVLAGVALAVGLLSTFVGTSLTELSGDLPQIRAKLASFLTSRLGNFHLFGIKFSLDGIRNSLDPGAAFTLAKHLIGGLDRMLANSFLVAMTVIFILLEVSVSPAGKTPLSMISAEIQEYMAIKTVTSLATGVAVAIWLRILDVPYPVMWGLLAFLLNFIPNIGSILAAAPAILTALVERDATTALLAAVGYVVVNFVVGNVVEPRVMGASLGLRMLVVFLSLIFWGWVLGPVGMVLAVPLTMAVQSRLCSYEQTKWMGDLLAPTATSPGPTPRSRRP